MNSSHITMLKYKGRALFAASFFARFLRGSAIIAALYLALVYPSFVGFVELTRPSMLGFMILGTILIVWFLARSFYVIKYIERMATPIRYKFYMVGNEVGSEFEYYVYAPKYCEPYEVKAKVNEEMYPRYKVASFERIQEDPYENKAARQEREFSPAQ